MSASPCAPFSTPEDMTVGEGAGFFVLERERRKEARVRAAITGFASTCDAHHATAPDATGKQLARAMRVAMHDACVSPEAIGFVSAHGTGTASNDPAEHVAIRSVLGRGAVVTASKSMFGHALGAASVLEVAAVIAGFDSGAVPRTSHFAGPRFPLEIEIAHQPIATTTNHVLKSAAAFGGFNVAMVVSRGADPKPRSAEEDVVVVGASHYTHETELDILDREAAAITDVRAFDGLGRHLLVLAQRALPIPVRGGDRERVGIVVGAPAMAADTLDELWDAIKTRGYERSSAPAFARTVMNAPAGAVARALGLKGPCSTLASRAVSGAQAIVEAARSLARSTHADMLVAASAYELDTAMHEYLFNRYRGQTRDPNDAGAALVLARRSFAVSRGLPIRARVAGTAVTGPTTIRAAIDRVSPFDHAIVACADDDDARVAVRDALGDVPTLDASVRFGDPESLDVLAATLALENTGRTLVLAYDQAVGAVAIVFAS